MNGSANIASGLVGSGGQGGQSRGYAAPTGGQLMDQLGVGQNIGNFGSSQQQQSQIQARNRVNVALGNYLSNLYNMV